MATETTQLTDDLNTQFLFSSTFTELLCQIVSGKISAKDLAWKELRNRGLDANGKWIGFDGHTKAPVDKPF